MKDFIHTFLPSHKYYFMPYFQEFLPAPELADLIRVYQIYHVKWNEEKDFAPAFITCLANTEQNLYLLPNDTMKVVPAVKVEFPTPAATLTGPKNKPVGLLFGENHLMIKVAFHPTGMYRLCGLDMKETVNKGIDATQVWGNKVNDLLEQLRKISAYEEQIKIVAAFLLAKYNEGCRPKEPIDDVAIAMLDPANIFSLPEWASRACLSTRQFERNFTTRVGLSPKLFVRIVRFEHAMKVKNETGKSWTEVAEACNYSDSSHLLKEFREFAEFPPSMFYLQPTSGHSALATG
jgi:AraC-like DNA-binding protein